MLAELNIHGVKSTNQEEIPSPHSDSGLPLSTDRIKPTPDGQNIPSSGDAIDEDESNDDEEDIPERTSL